MEKVTDINRWLLNRERKQLVSIVRRSLRWCTATVRCLSKRVRSRHIFASLDFRLPWPACCEKLFHGCHNGRVWIASLASRFRCLEGSVDMLSEQKPYIGIGRDKRKFVSDSCLDTDEHICRIRVLASSLSVVRKRSSLCALAGPFNVSMKIIGPKFISELKSITLIFSHNLLNLFALQLFSKILTGQ